MTGTPSGPLPRPGPAEQPKPDRTLPSGDRRDIEPGADEPGDDATTSSPGRVALVTCAALGIGRASTRRLAEAGWRVVLVDVPAPLTTVGYALDYALSGLTELTEATATCLAAARRRHGRGLDRPPASPLPAESVPAAVGVVADVRRRADLEVAVATAQHYYGRLDAVVAAAGILARGWTLWNTPLSAYEELLAVNLTGVFHLIGAAVPGLTSGPGREGRIVVVAPRRERARGPLRGEGRSRGPRPDARGGTRPPRGHRERRLSRCDPGPMLEALAQVYGLPTIDNLAAHHPASMLADPDDPAALIAWLCHPDSRVINGAVLPVDAGFSAHLGAQLGVPRPAGPETGPSAGG